MVEKRKAFQWQKAHTLLTCCIVGALLLLASHWLFLENLHNRVHGVLPGLNVIIQVFGSLFAVFVSLAILIAAIAGKCTRLFGFVSAFLLGSVACYCLATSFGILVRM